MIDAFDAFKDDKDNPADPPPYRWNDEQLIYGLCDEKIIHREWVLDNVTYKDALKWFLHKRYSAYAVRMAMEQK